MRARPPTRSPDMLEHATLLLRPPDPSMVQAVADPATGASLGFARRRPPGLWERWLGGWVVEVYEQEDASLLCTIRRGWLRPQCRLVYDADEQGVGVVRGRRLEDRRGRVIALRWQDAAGKGDVYRDPAGRPLATVRPGRDGLAVAFTEEVTADPFAKMLVLAAALQG